MKVLPGLSISRIVTRYPVGEVRDEFGDRVETRQYWLFPLVALRIGKRWQLLPGTFAVSGWHDRRHRRVSGGKRT